MTDDVAPDGSPIEFYRQLLTDGEPELIHAAMKQGGPVLDLGCGAGRIAAGLVALGHPVTGIDNSSPMIGALPPGIEGVVADARTVRLGRRFDAVLMASHLLDDLEDGPAFAATAAAHVASRGVVIAETYPPGWDPARSVGHERRLGGGWVSLVRATVEADVLDAEVRYRIGDKSWNQPFKARLMDEAAIRALLTQSGLRFGRWLPRPGWFVATPVPPAAER